MTDEQKKIAEQRKKTVAKWVGVFLTIVLVAIFCRHYFYDIINSKEKSIGTSLVPFTVIHVEPIKVYPVGAPFDFPINVVESEEINLVRDTVKYRLHARCKDPNLTVMVKKNGDSSTTMEVSAVEDKYFKNMNSVQFWIKPGQSTSTAKMEVTLTKMN